MYVPRPRIAALALTLTSAAHGEEPPTAHLVLQHGEGTDDCPDEVEVRDSVAAQLGYVPFRDGGRPIRLAFVRRQGRLIAELRITTDTGEEKLRQIASATNDCAELGRSAALAIGIDIDPLGVGRERAAAKEPPKQEPRASPGSVPPAARPPAPAPAPPADTALPVAPTTESAAGLTWRVRLSGRGSVGETPTPAAGGALEVGGRGGSLSVGLEGRYHARAESDAAGGTLEVQTTSVALNPCWHAGVLAACAVGTVGRISGRGGRVSAPRDDSGITASVGAALGPELPLVAPLVAAARVEGAYALSRPVLVLDGQQAWRQPPAGLSIEIGVLGEFP